VSFLELTNVSKGFGGPPVLSNLNLSVERGEFVAIVGYSGSGKTTLISLIAGLTRPDSGTVKLNDLEITTPGPDRGVVFQNYSLLPWLTGTENIALAVESARLRVRALDAAGREQVGARVRLMELNDAGGGRYQPGQIWSEPIGGPLACASFDVQPETAYGVRIEAKGFAALEDLVLLAQN